VSRNAVSRKTVPRKTVPRNLWIALAVLGVALTLTVIPGVFTIDEDNYLVSAVALRHGRLTVAGTEGMPPTAELAWFDPQSHSRRVDATPVAPTVPPLYAPLALPFTYLGWRALVALNTLAFLLTGALVFLWARRYADGGEAAGWLAAGAFLLGGYALEYAQGMWPHMIAVALTTGAAYLAARLRDGAALGWALLAGLAAGWAAGIRYQNVVLAALVGLGVFLFAPRRWRASLLYGAGVALPLAACSLLNHARLGSWNPISKGASYFSVSGGSGFAGGAALETLTMLWARVVDYAARPPLAGVAAVYLRPHPESGVYLLGPAVKKAWLQSAPWIAPVLLALALVWLWPRATAVAEAAAQAAGDAARRRLRELRCLALAVWPMLAVFAVAGASRTDGWSYNQRYFVELVPLAAVALAWILGDAVRRWRPLLLGAAVGALLAAAALARPPEAPVRHLAIAYLPLLVAALFTALWLFARRRAGALALVAGLALGWAVALHLGDDLTASRGLRESNRQRLASVADDVPQGAAVFAFWGAKDSLGPLLLDHDAVIADPFADGGEAAPQLVTAFLAAGRPVVVVLPFPGDLLSRMAAGRPVVRRGAFLAQVQPVEPPEPVQPAQPGTGG